MSNSSSIPSLRANQNKDEGTKMSLFTVTAKDYPKRHLVNSFSCKNYLTYKRIM